MRIEFYGTRGSIARPGDSTLRYGGNTSCVALHGGRGELLVLDAGTGLHDLGLALGAQAAPPRRGHLLIGHTHWDHIQGLPFFAPLFDPRQEWHVYGPRGFGATLRESLAGQMQYTYFPISLEQFEASVHYHDLVEGEFEIEGARVDARYLNHPALTLGYRIALDGAVLVYATDHEPHDEQHRGPTPAGARREAERHRALLSRADLVIHDAQYTRAEYSSRVGWGHSPIEWVVEQALAAEVASLALFHHDPQRDDAALERLEARAREQVAAAGASLEVFAAREGEAREVLPAGRGRSQAASPAASAREAPQNLANPVLLALEPGPHLETLKAALAEDRVPFQWVADAASLREQARSQPPPLVLVGRRLAGVDAVALARDLRRDGLDPEVPVVALAESAAEVDADAGEAKAVSDWLVAPFKPTYARTRLRAWLLRQACRWQPAPLPADEAARLAALHDLDVLDTPEEQRFDRYTRIAAALFDVPIALVSLVDAERQWFKSHHGLEARETPREQAICAHAILEPEPLIVPDALRDARFADNPLVTGPPHLRFYAGVPLELADGHRVGTLCLLDRRAREFDDAERALLQDLAALVARELVLPAPV